MSHSGSTSPTFTVTVQPSGRSFAVESGENILAAAIRQGIGLPYGCKDGACGSCKTRLVQGQVTHTLRQASALPQAERDTHVLTCCAVALTPLVLESRQVTEEGSVPPRKMPARVNQLARLSPDVMQLRLQLPASENFAYRAGQYLDVLLRDGRRRSYSMAGAPAAGALLELHIRHMPGGLFTDHVFGAMQEKEILRIEGPLGSFRLHHAAPENILMLASGTGFAPIKAMLEELDAQAQTRPVVLYWGGRRPADLYHHAWIEAFAQSHPWLRYIPVVSDAQPQDSWRGRSGLVHRAVLQDLPHLGGWRVYACGAPAMVHAARTDFLAAGLAEEAFHADAFTSQADAEAVC